MIKIGNIFINPDEVAAMYPSIHTEGKIWIVLKGGRSVWAIVEMETACRELAAAGVPFPPSSKVETERTTLRLLLENGYSYLARDESGALFASDGDPSKSRSGWDFELCRRMALDPDLFDGLVEWGDKEATDIEMLLEEMNINPEQYEE